MLETFCVTDVHGAYGNGKKYCRIIHFNDKQQPKTKSNCVFTAKCGILLFIPMFCIEQLKHFSNQYLILISVLQVSVHKFK